MARLVGINHVALEVGDIDAALDFYGRLFGFELRGRVAGRMAFVDAGDQFLALSAPRTQPPDDDRHFGLVVDDREAVRAALAARGSRTSRRAGCASATRGATRSRSSTTARSSSPRRPRCCAGWDWTTSRSRPRPWPSYGRRASPRRRRRRSAGMKATSAAPAATSAAIAPGVEPGARAGLLGQPAHQRRADRRRAEEHDAVERHHAPAHRRLHGDLQDRVDPGGERHRRRAQRHEGQQLEVQRGGEGDEQLGGAEGQRADDEQPRRHAPARAGGQRAADRADAHRRGERRVGRGRAVPGVVGQQRQQDNGCGRLPGPVRIALLPLLAHDTWHGTATTYATLTAAMGVGSICGALAAGARGRCRRGCSSSARWPSAPRSCSSPSPPRSTSSCWRSCRWAPRRSRSPPGSTRSCRSPWSRRCAGA